jgi:hypothetical protein
MSLVNQLQADRQLRLTDWGDIPFKPAVERGGEWYELPGPVTHFSLSDTWDGERFKTLLVDGDTVVGSTRNGVNLSLAGEISSPPGSALQGPSDLFAVLAELRDRLHVGSDDEKYRFYLYRDADAGTYRYFQSCTTIRLETDLSNSTAFQYRLMIHAEDPQIYDAL